MNSNVFNVCLKSVDGSNCYIKANSIPNICAPLCDEQTIHALKSQYPFIKELMVNNNIEDCGNDEIDILIGGDYYWNFVLNELLGLTKIW